MKQKISKVFIFINAIIICYILTLTTSYALYKDSLEVSGIASTVDYYDGTKLPTEPVVLDITNNRYHTASDKKNFLEFTSETWTGDNYILTYNKKAGIVEEEKNITYRIAFVNPTLLEYTNGTIKAEIVDNYNGRIKEVSASLSDLNVKPGQTSYVDFNVRFNFLTNLSTHKVKATVSYDLQGVTRYLYFTIIYN